MPVVADATLIQTRQCPERGVCGAAGDLDPQPVEDDIGKAYATHYIHETARVAPSLEKRVERGLLIAGRRAGKHLLAMGTRRA